MCTVFIVPFNFLTRDFFFLYDEEFYDDEKYSKL